MSLALIIGRDHLSTKSEVLLLYYYAIRAKTRGKLRGKCWPSKATIMADIHLNERTIDKINGKFRAMGILTWERGWGNRHKSHSNFYALNIEAMRKLAAETKQKRSLETCTGGGVLESLEPGILSLETCTGGGPNSKEEYKATRSSQEEHAATTQIDSLQSAAQDNVSENDVEDSSLMNGTTITTNTATSASIKGNEERPKAAPPNIPAAPPKPDLDIELAALLSADTGYQELCREYKSIPKDEAHEAEYTAVMSAVVARRRELRNQLTAA